MCSSRISAMGNGAMSKSSNEREGSVKEELSFWEQADGAYSLKRSTCPFSTCSFSTGCSSKEVATNER